MTDDDMTRFKTPQRTLALAACVVASWCHSARAVTPAELVTPELERRPVSVAGLSDETLSFFDRDRQLRREPVDGFVRLRFVQPATAAQPGADVLVEFVDGQRLAGRWLPPDGEGRLRVAETNGIEHGVLLDVVRRIAFADAGAEQREAASAADAVTLRNGERLEGFVAAATPEAVSVQIGDQAAPVDVPWAQVRDVRLGNPVVAPPASAGDHLLRLRDGGRRIVGGLEIAGDELRYTRARAFGAAEAGSLGEQVRASLPLASVESVDFLGVGWELVELADVPMELRSGGEVFGMTVAPEWRAGVLDAHAPATLAFTLPAGAERFAAGVELGLDDVPPHVRGWANVLVSAAAGSSASPPLALTAAQRVSELNLPLRGASELILTLDPAANAEILDRVRLRDAVILVRRAVTSGE